MQHYTVIVIRRLLVHTYASFANYNRKSLKMAHPHSFHTEVSSLFVTFRCFVNGTTRVKVLGWLKKKERKKEERKMTKLDFHHFQVRHSNNVYVQS